MYYIYVENNLRRHSHNNTHTVGSRLLLEIVRCLRIDIIDNDVVLLIKVVHKRMRQV